MKKILFLMVAMVSAFSCVTRQTADNLQVEIDSLKNQLKSKDAIMEEVFTSINEITTSLAEIRSREGILTISNDEITDTTVLGRMKSDVELIDNLLAENRARMEELQQKATQLRRANKRIKSLETLIADLNSQIDARDAELSDLKGRLQRMGEKVNELLGVVADKEHEVAVLTEEKVVLTEEVIATKDELNTAYYIIAPQKQLLSDRVVVKKGAIGRTLTVSDSINLNLFTTADTRILKTLPIGKKGVTVVTSHPEGSYWLVESETEKKVIESLVIVDSELFWSLSKILVISHK